jgi:hypothetical protein
MAVARAGQPREKVKRVRDRALATLATGTKHPKVSRRLVPHPHGLRRAVPSRLIAEPLMSRMVQAGRDGARLLEHHAPRSNLVCISAKRCTILWIKELSTAGTRRRKGLLPGVVGQVLFVTLPQWGFAKKEWPRLFCSFALARS